MTLKLLYSSSLENLKLLYKAPHFNKGRKHPHSPETIENYKKIMIGKKHTPEQNEKNRLGHLGKKRTPESIEKMIKKNIGQKRTPETCEKKRQANIKRYSDPKEREKMRLAHNTPEAKENHRKSRIKQIEKNYGITHPNYNSKACDYFELFDAKYNTKGQYAMYGGGEYQIKELGYFPDYINFDLHLIMEYDEKHHFNDIGKLCKKDIQRQLDIEKLYPDFEFFRIKENEQNLGVFLC